MLCIFFSVWLKLRSGISKFENFNFTLETGHNLVQIFSTELTTRFSAQEIITIPNGPEPLTLAVGATVGLLRNLSTRLNLVNGSVGTVRAIVPQKRGKKVKFILVDFGESYRGSVVVKHMHNGHPVYGVPIFPMRMQVLEEGRMKSFTAIPLALR